LLGFALADTSGDGRAFRNPDAVLVLLECGDEFHELILTRKFKVSRVDAVRGIRVRALLRSVSAGSLSLAPSNLPPPIMGTRSAMG